jgi:hypothetical protein
MTIKSSDIQTGLSGTATDNFTLQQGTAGQLKISRGNAGETTADPIVINADNSVSFVGDVVAPNLAALPYLSGRNKIINGGMAIAQRGTSQAAVGAGYSTVDRWAIVNNDTIAVVSDAQAADGATPAFGYSKRLTVTTADPSITGGDRVHIQQTIEGFNCVDLINTSFTLSFWVRSAKVGIHCLSIINSGGDRSYVGEYSIAASNTWEYKSLVITGGLITAGTWNRTNGAGMLVRFSLAAGPTFQTTKDAWQVGNYTATSNQVNCLDTIGNIFAITGVQLEAGSVATPFEHRSYGQELALCQRYYQTPNRVISVVKAGGTWQSTPYVFPVIMRSAPSIIISSQTFQGDWGGPTNIATDRLFFIGGQNGMAASSEVQPTFNAEL